LLQGPVGPFFSRLAHDLQLAGARAFKVNFNAGDPLFYRPGGFPFKGATADWPPCRNPRPDGRARRPSRSVLRPVTATVIRPRASTTTPTDGWSATPMPIEAA